MRKFLLGLVLGFLVGALAPRLAAPKGEEPSLQLWKGKGRREGLYSYDAGATRKAGEPSHHFYQCQRIYVGRFAVPNGK